MSGVGSPVLWPVTAPRDPERSTQPRAAAWALVRKPCCLSMRIHRGALRSTTSFL